MNTFVHRGRAIACCVLLFSPALLGVTTTPASALANGTLVVTVVDQQGQPVVGFVQAYDIDGNAFSDAPDGEPPVASDSHTFDLPPGGYGLTSITPWSGLDCLGTTPCALAGTPAAVTPTVEVVSDSSATSTISVTVPTTSGTPAVGSPLTVDVPPGLTLLEDELFLLEPFSSLTGPRTQQWTRSGSDVVGDTGPAHVVVEADQGTTLAARLTAAESVAELFGLSGLPVAPFTTEGVAVAGAGPGPGPGTGPGTGTVTAPGAGPVTTTTSRSATTTTVSAPRRVTLGARPRLRITVAAATGVPDGLVAVRVGRKTITATLSAGKAVVKARRLKAGRQEVSASYLGSMAFGVSTSAAVTIRVRR